MNAQNPSLLQTPGASPSIHWGWAGYLAASWTWCVGMFLPVLLVRDFGLWGWVAFAAPNVLGAAAVGRWVYASDPQGPWLLDRHVKAMKWFSIITIAFHVYFVAWWVHRLMGMWALPMFVIAVIFFSAMVRLEWSKGAGWLALGFSAVMGWIFFRALGGQMDAPAVHVTSRQLLELTCLLPAIVAGFVLCPHMDLTLQRARRAMPLPQSAMTFAAAYLGLFLLMIVLTLCYGPSLEVTLATGQDLLLPASAAMAIAFHMCVQAGYTVSLHAGELIRTARPRNLTRSLLLFVVAMIVLLVVGRSIVPGARLLGYDPGEVIYRIFIGFYGIMFPTYAWAAWLWRKHPRLSTTAWLAPVLITMPMFAAGFLAHRPIWILPAVAVMTILPWLLLPRDNGNTPSDSQAQPTR